MKYQRAAAEQAVVSLALTLSLGAVAHSNKIKLHRSAAAGSEEFTCKTCGRSFPTFQALGGHRTSHLRGRNGLALVLTAAHKSVEPKKTTSTDDQKPAVHHCHVCGLGFGMGQALGGHMRRHREEAATVAPPVLLELFV